MRLFIYYKHTPTHVIERQPGETMRKWWRRGIRTLRGAAGVEELGAAAPPEVMARSRYRPHVNTGPWWLVTADRTLQPRYLADPKGLP